MCINFCCYSATLVAVYMIFAMLDYLSGESFVDLLGKCVASVYDVLAITKVRYNYYYVQR